MALDAPTLALLYRHALLARALDLPVADLLRQLRLAGAGPVRDRAGLDALLAADADRRGLGVSLDAAAYVVDGVPATPAQPTPDSMAAELARRLGRDRTWEFGDTLLTAVPGITEADSRRILAANTAAAATDPVGTRPLEQAPGSSLLRLRAEVDPAAAGWLPVLPTGYAAPDRRDACPSWPACWPGSTRWRPPATRWPARSAWPGTRLTELLRLCGPAGATAQPLSAGRTATVAAAYAADPATLRAAVLTPRPLLLRLAVLFGTPTGTRPRSAVADDRDRAAPLGIVFDPTGSTCPGGRWSRPRWCRRWPSSRSTRTPDRTRPCPTAPR